METQLQLCRDLFQAVLSSKDRCHVPASFNLSLLDALQRLMLELQQLQQEEQTRAVRQCLEAALQLLSRASCLGPIESFFTADDLLLHYQRRLDQTIKLTNQLHEQRQQRAHYVVPPKAGRLSAASGPYITSSKGDSSNTGSPQLQLPQQQSRAVTSFRQQAAELCPRLVGSCTSEQLQQLCDTVKEGLVLVNGHSFLIDQGWQLEVSNMMSRAEQLKVLLAHRQAHHISLLAQVLQLIHRMEVQEFDSPQHTQQQLSATGQQGLKSAHSRQSQLSSGLSTTAAALAGAKSKAVSKSGSPSQHGQAPQQQATVVVAAALEAAAEVLGDEVDEFYMPVAPLATLSSSAGSTPRSSAMTGSPLLPFDLNTSTVELSDDSLARMPSSGCSSLLEYVHNTPPGAAGTGTSAGEGTWSLGSFHGTGLHSTGHSSSSTGQSALRRITEEQLHGIASPDIANILAAALGLSLDISEPEGPSHVQSVAAAEVATIKSVDSRAGGSSTRGRCRGCEPDSQADLSSTAAFPLQGSESGTFGVARSSSPSREGLRSGLEGDFNTSWGSEAASRQSSEPLMSRLISSSSRAGSSQQLQQQQQRRPRSGGNRTSSPAVETSGSSSHGQHPWSNNSGKRCQQCELRLQHRSLPPGCCKSIGAVLYISPHISRLVLVNVGIDDQAVFELVDALKVNSSLVLLDLSQNRVEDIGARALAGLLRQREANSSRLRALYLQENLIGDDGARALATALRHNSTLQRLWLQQNAIGESGAVALASAMQHNTSCTSLKLLPQSTEGLPAQLGQMAQRIAKHNKGVREHIKDLLVHVLRKQSDS